MKFAQPNPGCRDATISASIENRWSPKTRRRTIISSEFAAANIEESSNRSPQSLNTPIPVGIIIPLLHNPLNSFANTRITLEPPSQEKVRPESFAPTRVSLRPLSGYNLAREMAHLDDGSWPQTVHIAVVERSARLCVGHCRMEGDEARKACFDILMSHQETARTTCARCCYW